MRTTILTLLLIILLAVYPAAARAAQVQQIAGHNGVTAWLVEDHKLPLVAVHFAFRGGVEQDPEAKQGLADLSMNLLTEGAGTYDAAAFQQKLSDHSIALAFTAERDTLQGSLKMLSADRDDAFELLALALTQPKIDNKDFQRLRGQQLARLRAQFGDPGWQARHALFRRIFGDHPYGRRHLGTATTLAALTPDDARKFIASHLAQDNLVVAIAGDMTAAEVSAMLDKVFGSLPRHARLDPVADFAFPPDGTTLLLPRDGTQTELLFAMPGPKQDDPEWHAAEIANYILGGGGFSSRLMQDVRDKKGLTYGIDTSLAPADHGGMIVGQAATDNAKTQEAWDVALATMRHFYEDGATGPEIAAAKDYLTGSLPLALTSTERIAGVLVELQLEKRPADYLDRRNDALRKITADQVQAVIKRWFNPDRLILSMVGKPDNMNAVETGALVRE